MQLPRYTQPTTTTRRTTTTTRIQRNPSCLDDNTEYYGGNVETKDGFSSSSECRERCDRVNRMNPWGGSCGFWSFMKSSGRCLLKHRKVLWFTYFAFTCWTQRSAFTVYFVMVLRLLFCCIDSFIVKELYSEGLKNVMMLAHFYQNLHFLLLVLEVQMKCQDKLDDRINHYKCPPPLTKK